MLTLVKEPVHAIPVSRPPTETTRRPNARCRARLGVLTALTVFVFFQLVTAVVLEMGPDRDPLYSVRLTRLLNQQRAPDKSLTIVMLGSSRTECALRSAELHELLTHSLNRPVAVGNFGLSACGYPMQLLTWNRLRHDGVRPDLVLIEVMPAMLNENWHGNDLKELSEERLPLGRVRYCDLAVIERFFADVRPGLRQEWLWAWPNPLYTQRLNLVGRFAPQLLAANQRLWMNQLPEDKPANSISLPPDLRQRALDQAYKDYVDNLQHFRLGGQGYRCLRELLARIQEEGMSAALVILPEGPAFQSWYPPGVYRTVRDELDTLAAEFGIAVLDLHDGMEESDFLDSHHLTPESAAKFTARLGKEHLLPLLQQQAAAGR